jgi:DNA repair exonuclease SbcCD ATPase subunit
MQPRIVPFARQVLALQGSIKQQNEEADKLRDEIKTLKNMMGRQERAINQSKDLDNDYAAKLQSIIGDLTVAKDENRRLRERLEASEKTAKSRSAIEEGMRRKVEGLEKKLKAQKELLKEKVAEQVSGSGAGGGIGTQGVGGAGGGADGNGELAKAREEIEAVNKRLLVSESEGKKLKVGVC